MQNIPVLRQSYTRVKAQTLKDCGLPFSITKNKVHLNEQTLGRLFARYKGVFWDAGEKCFLDTFYNSGPLNATSSDAVKGQVREFVLMLAQYAKISPDRIHLTTSKMNGILAVVKLRSPAPAFPHHNLFPTTTDVIRFGTDKVRALRFYPEYGFRTYSRYIYKPSATCPKFEQLVRQSVPNDDDRKLLQMYLGAPLTGLNLTRRMLLIRGPGGSSKSTIMRIQEDVLSRGWVGDLRAGMLDRPFEKSHILGKRQLSAKDVPANFLASNGAKSLKHLLGGDITQAEIKYGGKVDVGGSYFVIITSNGELRLSLEDDEDAWLDRLLVVQCQQVPHQLRVAGYADVLLQQEGSGIMNWLIKGGMMYVQEVRNHGDIRLTPDQKARVENLVLASKSLDVFVSSKIIDLHGGRLTNNQILWAYARFCQQRGWVPVSSQMLTARLPDLMLHKHGTMRSVNYADELGLQKAYANVTIAA